MNQVDSIIKVLSEQRAGSKLKCIFREHREDVPISVIKFVFEDGKDIERFITIGGKNLGIGFGCQKIDND